MLSINLDGLENDVKPSMEKTMRYLQNAQDIISSIAIPSDFSYAGTLRSIPGVILDIYSQVNGSKKWLDECISNFDMAENKNKTLFGNIEDLLSSFNIFETSSQRMEKESSNNIIEDAVSGLFSTANDVLSTFLESDLVEGIMATGQEIMASTGAVVSEGWEFLFENILQPAGNIILGTGASVANVFISAVKGLGSLAESLFDAVVLIGTASITIPMCIVDAGWFLLNTVLGNTSDLGAITGSMWSGVMSFVAEDHVGNVYSDFYKNNVIGQWLDEHAFEWFKSDGPITGLVSGLGYVAGIIGISILTAGIGGLITGGTTALSSGAITGISAATAGIAGFGEGTEQFWGEKRDASIEGFGRLLERGEITQEQYDEILLIKGMTQDEWKQIELAYREGKISKEDYDMIKQIREMPDDWKTLENFASGVGYGTLIGLWEGGQWYLGGKLSGIVIPGKQGLTSAVRIGIDSTFNAGDTPYRALVDTIISGGDFFENFEKQGGIDSVLTNFGIGLIGSIGGEAWDVHNINKIADKLNNLEALNKLDESLSTRMKEILEKDNKLGKININNMTDSDLNKYIYELLNKRKLQIEEASKYLYGGQINNISEFSDTVIQKITDGIDAISKTGLLDNMDEASATRIRNAIANDYFRGKIDLKNSSNAEISKYINDYIKQKDSTINIIKEKLFGGKDINFSEKILTKIEDGYNLIYKSGILDKFDEKGTNNLVLLLMDDYLSGKIDLKNISETKLRKYYDIDNVVDLNNKNLSDEIIDNVQNIFKNLDEKFEIVFDRTGIYGVDQGVFRDIWNRNPDYAEQLVEKFSKKYGMSKETTTNVMKLLDSIGACSYADICNGIISKFIDKPDEFKEIFGFTLYNSTYGGFNSEELLFDMYVWMNSAENGGKLFDIDQSGQKVIIDKLNNDKFSDQKYMTNFDAIDKYLKSKSNELGCNVESKKTALYNSNGIKNLIIEAINDGKEVSILTHEKFIYTELNTDITALTIGSRHITKVVGITEDKIIVISWGKKYYINISDLENNQDCYLYFRDITIK